jgi:hypothetical protein
MFRAIVASLVLLWAGQALAGSYTYYSGSGYYLDSYGTSYTRVDNGYWYRYSYGNGCYGPWQWYSSYTYSPVKVNYASAEAEDQIIALAKIREKWVGDVAKINQRAQSNLLLADKLGLNQNIPNYGAGIFPVGSYQGQLTISSGAQGSTVYGQANYKTQTDAFNVRFDADAANLSAARLVEGAQGYTRDAHAGYQTMVSGAVGNITRSVERTAVINALGQASRGDPELHQKTELTYPVPVPKLDGPEALPLPKPRAASRSCVVCHGPQGDSAKAFRIDLYQAGADEKMDARVFAYIKPGGSPKRHCPPGKQLTWDEIGQITSPREPAAKE